MGGGCVRILPLVLVAHYFNNLVLLDSFEINFCRINYVLTRCVHKKPQNIVRIEYNAESKYLLQTNKTARIKVKP